MRLPKNQVIGSMLSKHCISSLIVNLGHAWLAPCVRNASGKMKQSPSVAWSETLSSTIHRHTQGQPIHHQAIIDMVIYHKAIAFTARDSDKVMLNDFVLFSDDKNSIVHYFLSSMDSLTDIVRCPSGFNWSN